MIVSVCRVGDCKADSRRNSPHFSQRRSSGLFCLGTRCLRRAGHLRLFLPDQQPGLRRVRAKVHEAGGNILSEILQARFDNSVIGPDFPRDPLSLFVYLTGNRRLLATPFSAI
jgi:hypothetical protein